MSATLRDLLAHRTPVEWFEAVAIVQALCKRLLDDPPAADVRVPDLHQIVLGADGTIDVTGKGPDGQSPVFRVGEVLTALVGEDQMPVPLRLLVLRAVSPAPPYHSVDELTTALAYYERPDRAVVLRGVYDRYQQLPARAESVDAVQEIPAAPVPRPQVRVPSWWKRHPAVVVTGFALVLTAAAAGAFVALRSRVPWIAQGPRQVVQLAGATTDAVAKTVSSGVEVLRTRLGVATAVDVKAVAPPQVSAPPPAMPRGTRALSPDTGGWTSPAGAPIPAPATAPATALDRVVDPTSIPDSAAAPRAGRGAGRQEHLLDSESRRGPARNSPPPTAQ